MCAGAHSAAASTSPQQSARQYCRDSGTPWEQLRSELIAQLEGQGFRRATAARTGQQAPADSSVSTGSGVDPGGNEGGLSVSTPITPESSNDSREGKESSDGGDAETRSLIGETLSNTESLMDSNDGGGSSSSSHCSSGSSGVGKSNLPEESDAEVGKVVRMCPGCGKASVRLSVDAMLGKVVASCSTAGCGSCTVQLSMPGASKGSSDGSGSGSSTSSKKSRGGTLNSQGIIVKPRPAGNGRASAVISKPGGKVQRVGERSGGRSAGKCHFSGACVHESRNVLGGLSPHTHYISDRRCTCTGQESA